MSYKFGKLAPKPDSRNIKFMSLLPVKLPIPPPAWDVDVDDNAIWPLPLPKFANDQWGDCVIAGRANQTLRFEKAEQGEALEITDEDVLKEYWAEQGDPDGTEKPDNGLYILESLKAWRKGWTAAGQTYNIYAFAEIDRHRQMEVQQAIWLLRGLQAGVYFRESDIQQIDRGEIWTVSSNPGGYAGGHCMFIIGYTRTGPVFLTWGQRQVATWEWFFSRCDELYGVVDDKDRFIDSPLDVDKLNAILKAVTK